MIHRNHGTHMNQGRESNDQSEKGKDPDGDSAEISPGLPDRAHARSHARHESFKRFPGLDSPPNHRYIYIYILYTYDPDPSPEGPPCLDPIPHPHIISYDL